MTQTTQTATFVNVGERTNVTGSAKFRKLIEADDYAGALAACLDGGHWEDAAFVAERVMTTAELIQFVDTRPVPPPPRSRPDNESWPVHPETSLRELLARRLTRAG